MSMKVKTPLNASQAHLSPCPDTGINITMPENKAMQDIRFSLDIVSQAHTDLSEICSVIVCEYRALALNVFYDLKSIKAHISGVCSTLESYPKYSPFYRVHEECDLADGFLTCLFVTLWNDDNLPAPKPLEWREAMMIYAAIFTAMHRLGKAIDGLKHCAKVEFGYE
jgi:hypothetical protein